MLSGSTLPELSLIGSEDGQGLSGADAHGNTGNHGGG